MKVKSDSVKLSNSSKNALPTTCKILKPKKFKNTSKAMNKTKVPSGISMNKDKLALAVNSTNMITIIPEKKKKLENQSLQTLSKKSRKTSYKPKKNQNEPSVAHEVFGRKKLKRMLGSLSPKTIIPQELLEASEPVPIKSTGPKTKHGRNKPKLLKRDQIKAKNRGNTKLGLVKDAPVVKQKILGKKHKKNKPKGPNSLILESKLDSQEVAGVVRAVLKLAKTTLQGKPVLLDEQEPIFLMVGCVKMPVCTTKQIKFKLPHPLVNELSDILLITADKKGSKIHPDKAVEHYSELLEKHGVKFVQKVMPLRSLRQEYSQFEMRKKLVDQFDLILADANIMKSLPGVLGRNIMFKRKMPIAVHLDRRDLKAHLELAVSKTQMTVKSYRSSSIVQVGHSDMDAKEIAENILAVSKVLPDAYPGGWANVRSLEVKSASSVPLVIYMNLISPNMVKAPGEPSKTVRKIEDELSTYPGMNVVVKQDGSVSLKKVKEEKLIDNSHDDEILKQAQDYIQSSRTVRYSDDDDDDDDSDEDEKAADSITDRMEKQLLSEYKKKAKKAIAEKNEGGEEDDDEDEDEEEESSEEDTPVIPPIGKKRKMAPVKKQSKSGPPKKQQKEMKPQQKSKGPIGKPQNRGSRGGKKQKMSKDQRKALIKRKKAGAK